LGPELLLERLSQIISVFDLRCEQQDAAPFAPGMAERIEQ
jgi:hypothetical protein